MLNRREFLAAAAALAPAPRTVVSIHGDAFHINGQPTYPGRFHRGHKVEGLLLNVRAVQATFDDRNPVTRTRWKYADTGAWDPERNTREFLAALPEWRRHGLRAFTINLQGGSPEGYSKAQPWHNSAIEADGALHAGYMRRVASVLDRADELGMVVILGIFYFGQDQRVSGENEVRAAVRETIDWILARGYRNVLLEINNEADVQAYDHAILKPPRVHELIAMAKGRIPVGTSFRGGAIPTPNVVEASDFLLLHGNGVSDPRRITQMVDQARKVPGYRRMPILFNEDDHFDFEQPVNNMTSALASYASWGYFDPEGYQCPPVRWGIDTPRKQAFFKLVEQVTGGSGRRKSTAAARLFQPRTPAG